MFSPFPLIETPRLLLRRPLKSDAADIFEFRSNPEVMKYIPRPLARNLADAEALVEMIDGFVEAGQRINWAIEWRETGKMIGMIGYVNIYPEHHRAEIGYVLNDGWHRRGIMREALSAAVTHGFAAFGFHSILAIIDAENIASGNLLETAGFTKEAYFREDFLHNGQYRNSVYYGLLATDKR